MNQAAPELLPEDYKETLDIVRQCIKKYGYFTLEPDAKCGTRVLDALTRAAQQLCHKHTAQTDQEEV